MSSVTLNPTPTTNTPVFENRSVLRFFGTILFDSVNNLNGIPNIQLNNNKTLPLAQGVTIHYALNDSDILYDWRTQLISNFSSPAYLLYYIDNGTNYYLVANANDNRSHVSININEATIFEIKQTSNNNYSYFSVKTVFNEAPVLSNNITISEIYGQTNYSINLNDYTTDVDSSLTEVVYTLNPNGSVFLPNNTTLRFWMRDVFIGIDGNTYGDTWNGGNAVIRNSSNSVVATLTGPSSRDPFWIYQDIVLSGVNTITWTGGSWTSEPQLFITSPSYSWASNNGDPPAIGGDVYYRTVGITNRTDTLNIATPLLGVSLSGSILTLNSTLYNCDEFYITAKNTGITYTSNTATCSFTRLTATYNNGFGELTRAIVTSLLNNKTNVVITDYSSIGASAFQDASGVTSITIPSSVASIGASAFQGMTGLRSITIPSSVISIGGFVFYGATALNSVTFAEGSQLNSIGNSAFRNASNLISVTIPSGVTSIGQEVFRGASSLTSVVFAEGSQVNSITFRSFYHTGLTSIIIPASVTSIGESAFEGASNLTSVTFAEGSQLNSIGNSAFKSPNLTSISFPAGVTSIPYQAFQNASKLTSVTFAAGSQLKSIGDNAFHNTTILTSITIPSGVTSIGASAFQGATGLTSITIPSSVTTIGASAFQNATSLTSITIPSSVTIIGSSAFQGSGIILAIFETSTLLHGLSITNGPSKTLYGKSSIDVYLSSNVFNGTGPLTSTIVNDNSLSYTNNLTITGFSSIGESAFSGATSLTSITIPSGVTSIGNSAFSLTSSLTSVIFEAGSQLTSIGNNAFDGASALTSITIPSGVSSIGAQSFENTALTTAFFESVSTVTTLGLLNGDLINGYTVSSFYGKSSVTIRYTEAVRATISAAPAAIISNNTFTSLLTNMGINISNMTSQVIPFVNDPYIEYSTKLTIPNGNLYTLSFINKANIVNTVKELYAAQVGINVNKLMVTLEIGSIIVNVNVLKDGVTDAMVTDAMVPICFPKGTPVTTNQGVIAIEKLNPDIHTIRGKKIVAITQTRPIFEHIIAIDKNALGKNVPSAPIQISKEHKVFYKREMVKAKDLVEVCEGVRRIPYNGETLYNVLMEKHEKMMINNLICETLDPDNIMSKICGGKYNRYEQSNICKELNDIIRENNVPAYIKLYDSLK